jgi:hypothetical protein
MARVHSSVHSVLALAVGLAGSGCAAAGPYGYARTYSTLDTEKAAAQGAVDYDPVMTARTPRNWQGKKVSVFGRVAAMKTLPNGATEVQLTLHTLQPRNLCENDDQTTCRVTISEASFGSVYAELKLLPENQSGEGRVAPGSLLRVLGTVDPKPHAETGNTVITAQYYRHWPSKTFVTTAARSYMLR